MYTQIMAGKATPIIFTEQERNELEVWVRKPTMERRSTDRARIVLEAATGKTTLEIARSLKISRSTVSKWRTRFARQHMEGLMDKPRGGAKVKYGAKMERRILKQLDEPLPPGHTTWTGGLVAQSLGDVTASHVWRVLRKHRVHLQRRRSWCISTDPQFAQKAADVIGLYLYPPENAVVLCVDEKPAIQALERAQGWLRLPNGEALRGFSHEYKRHGTTTLFAALEVATGLAHAGHYRHRRRREFLDFMNQTIALYPDNELHVILDNLNTHKPKHDRWLGRHPGVHFHYIPTHASWLNQVEVWFSILSRQVLRGLNATSVTDICRAIDAFTTTRNEHPIPFEWHKSVVNPVNLKHHYANLCN
jgi:transposase